MDWPKIARTSSSFFELPVTNVTGRDRTGPDPTTLAAAILRSFSPLFLRSPKGKDFDGKLREKKILGEDFVTRGAASSNIIPCFYIYISSILAQL